MLRKYTVKLLRVLGLASQLMIITRRANGRRCRLANSFTAAGDFTFIRVKFRLRHK